MISKVEYTELFQNVLRDMLNGCDTNERIESYIRGIDYDDVYAVCKSNIEDDPTLTPVQEANQLAGGYYYMMYPEY